MSGASYERIIRRSVVLLERGPTWTVVSQTIHPRLPGNFNEKLL